MFDFSPEIKVPQAANQREDELERHIRTLLEGAELEEQGDVVVGRVKLAVRQESSLDKAKKAAGVHIDRLKRRASTINPLSGEAEVPKSLSTTREGPSQEPRQRSQRDRRPRRDQQDRDQRNLLRGVPQEQWAKLKSDRGKKIANNLKNAKIVFEESGAKHIKDKTAGIGFHTVKTLIRQGTKVQGCDDARYSIQYQHPLTKRAMSIIFKLRDQGKTVSVFHVGPGL